MQRRALPWIIGRISASEGEAVELLALWSMPVFLVPSPIGSVAKLSDEELETLVQAAAAQAQMPSVPSICEGALILNSPIVRDCIEALKTFDADALTTRSGMYNAKSDSV
jgi:hypothetical protein